MPVLSIIVPVYNVEKFLRECVESILSQSFTDYELILVDDGSTDGSGERCDEWAAKIRNKDRLMDTIAVTVIHQANRGVSNARNTGIDACHGELIGFVDSDDYICPGMFSRLAEILLEEEADVAVCAFEREHNLLPGKASEPVSKKGEPSVLSGKEALVQIITNPGGDAGFTPWNKLCRSTLLPFFRYADGHVYEDVEVTVRILLNSRKVVWIPDKLYVYCRHKGGICQTVSVRNTEDHIRSHLLVEDLTAKYCPEAYPFARSNTVLLCISEWTRLQRCEPAEGTKVLALSERLTGLMSERRQYVSAGSLKEKLKYYLIMQYPLLARILCLLKQKWDRLWK